MATGEDQRRACVSCGEEFLFTAGEQEFFRERGLTHAPTRCKRCRDQRKKQRPEGAADAAPPARPGRPARPGPVPARPPDSSSPEPGARRQGAVKWFNKSKGFGFLRDDGGEEIFVHSSALSGDDFTSLTPGERVGFDVVVGARGKQAVNVTRLG